MAASSIPIRSWFEGQGQKVNWDPNTKTITTSGGMSFSPSDYQISDDKAYIDPAKLAGQYVGKPQSQMTQETLQPYVDTARQMYEPIYNARSDALQRALDRIQSQAESQRGQAEADWQSSSGNLQRSETGAWNAITKSALSRGLGASPLASYEQRKVAETYAPAYQQLENNRAAALANISSQAALGSEALAAQAKELEAQLMQDIMGAATGQFQQAQATEQAQLAQVINYLLGQENTAYERERQGQQDALQRRLTEAGLTGIDPLDGQKTWQRQYQENSLANALARASGGGGSGSATATTRSNYASAVQGVADALSVLKGAHGTQQYADNFSTESGVLAPIQIVEEQINMQRPQLIAQGIDADKLIDDAYKMAYGVDRKTYWAQANKAIGAGDDFNLEDLLK